MHLIFLHCEMGHSKVLKDLPKKSFKLSVFAEIIILKLLIFLILIIGPFRLFNFFQEIFVNLYFSTNIHFNEIFKLFFCTITILLLFLSVLLYFTHFLIPIFVCLHVQSLQLCLTLCDPMDCSPPGFSVHGILPARLLEWAAMLSSRGSFRSRDCTLLSCVSCTAGRFFTTEPPGKPHFYL